jgi:hypothetical protein
LFAIAMCVVRMCLRKYFLLFVCPRSELSFYTLWSLALFKMWFLWHKTWEDNAHLDLILEVNENIEAEKNLRPALLFRKCGLCTYCRNTDINIWRNPCFGANRLNTILLIPVQTSISYKFGMSSLRNIRPYAKH